LWACPSATPGCRRRGSERASAPPRPSLKGTTKGSRSGPVARISPSWRRAARRPRGGAPGRGAVLVSLFAWRVSSKRPAIGDQGRLVVGREVACLAHPRAVGLHEIFERRLAAVVEIGCCPGDEEERGCLEAAVLLLVEPAQQGQALERVGRPVRELRGRDMAF